MAGGREIIQLKTGATSRPYELNVSKIEQGGTSFYNGDATQFVLASGEDLTAARGPVIERLRPIDEGIEQFFEIASPLAESGDLRFHIAVRGDYRPIEDGTVSDQFTFWQGQLAAMTYGKVVVIDANGASIPRPLTFSQGVMTFDVPESWLAVASYPIVVDPTIGALIVISPASPNATVFHNNDVAFNVTAGNYFLVYNEIPAAGTSDLFGLTIDPTTGSPGPTLTILADASATYMPSIAWNPSNNRYLVIFGSNEVATAGANANEVNGMVLDATGAPVGGAAPFNISGGVGGATIDDYTPRVACDGTNWLVTWGAYSTTTPFPGDIKGRIVNAASTNTVPSFGTATFDIQATVSDDRFPAVAFGAGTYLVVWRNATTNRIEGRTVSTVGAVGATLQQYDSGVAAFTREEPSICANLTNSEFLVAWDEYDATLIGDPMTRRANSTGVPQGASPVSADPSATDDAYHVACAWNASLNEYIVFYHDDFGTGTYQIEAAQLNGVTGVVTGPNLLVSSPGNNGSFFGFPITSIAVRSGTTHVIMVWRLLLGAAPFPVQAQRWDMNLPPTDPTPAVLQQSHSILPAFVSDPAGTPAYTTLPRAMSFRDTAMVDPNPADTVQLQVEHVIDSAAFSGTPTGTQVGTSVNGAAGSLTINPIPNAQYKWQARIIDNHGATSNWVPFDVAATIDFEMNVPNQSPPAPVITQTASTGQFRLDGVTQILVGTATPEGSIIFKATIAADIDGDLVRLEVEVQPVGTAFTNVASVNSTFAAAGAHQVTYTPVTAVLPGGYHWQAWTRDNSSAPPSPLTYAGNTVSQPTPVAYGGNPDPAGVDFARDPAGNTTNPPGLGPTATRGQFEADGITTLALGATAGSRTVVFRGNVTDPQSDQVGIQVELQPVGTAFTGVPNLSGTMVATGSDSIATFSLGGFSAADYHWQARTIDALGAVSAFVTFGGNPEPSGLDFSFAAADPGGSRNNMKCALGAGAFASPWMLVLALMGLLFLRRR